MSLLILELFVILGLLLLNGLFAMSEIAIVTARRGRLEALASAGSHSARTALELAAEPTAFLSSAQIGITLIGILAGAFGGSLLATHLQVYIAMMPWLEAASEEVAFGVVVVAITFASLVIGELVPKRLALGAPERIAMVVAGPMRALARAASPAVRLLTASTHMILRVLRVQPAADQAVTYEDIRALVRQASAAGSMHASEAEIIVRALALGNRPVRAIMTPRPEIVSVDLGAGDAELRRRLASVSYRMVPVCSGSLDHVHGLLRIRDLLPSALSGGPLPLSEHILPPLFVPESLTVLRLIEQFRATATDAAIVLDEYGGMAGLVTRTDVLDDLAAGMPRQEGGEEEDIVQLEDGSWSVDGSCPIYDLEDRVGAALVAAGTANVHTVAGLVLLALGRVPCLGERAEAGGYRFEVVDLDGQRVDRIRVSRLPPPPAD